MKLHICKPLVKSMGTFGPHLYQPISENSRKRSAPTEPEVLEYYKGLRTTYKQPNKRQEIVDIRQSCEVTKNHSRELDEACIESNNAYQTLEKALSESTKANIEKEKVLLKLQTSNAEKDVARSETTRAIAEKENELQAARQEAQVEIDAHSQTSQQLQNEVQKTKAAQEEVKSLRSYIDEQLQPKIAQLQQAGQLVEGDLSQFQQTAQALQKERDDAHAVAQIVRTEAAASLDDERRKCQAVLDQAQDDRSQLQQAMYTLQKERDAAGAEVEAARASATAQLAEEKQKWLATLEWTEGDPSQLQEAVRALQKDRDTADARAESARADANAMWEQTLKLQAALREAEENQSRQQEMVDTLQMAMTTALDKAAELEKSRMDASMEHASPSAPGREELEDAPTAHVDLHTKIVKMGEENKRLRAEIECMKQGREAPALKAQSLADYPSPPYDVERREISTSLPYFFEFEQTPIGAALERRAINNLKRDQQDASRTSKNARVTAAGIQKAGKTKPHREKPTKDRQRALKGLEKMTEDMSIKVSSGIKIRLSNRRVTTKKHPVQMATSTKTGVDGMFGHPS